MRLLQGDEAPITLWSEVQSLFQGLVDKFCNDTVNDTNRIFASKLWLEYGLAEHHFDKGKKGKPYFNQALSLSGLNVEVTGAEGRRTKYQKEAIAQMLVRARPQNATPITNYLDGDKESTIDDCTKTEYIKKQMVDHQDQEENILLDQVTYVDNDDNLHYKLSVLEQAILLALCLDVKNENPMDGLTAEQMGAYLERVLNQHDDWMVYATGLLERAWLECERSHTRERAILQIQALADQHTNRLTLTQSTFKAAVEDSAPPNERLKNLHYIVYPPRWGVLRDLAERYAKIGIVTSAAEIFEEIELWDEVVECYRRAGKVGRAEQVVRSRLAVAETPRMWAALGDITNDPEHYKKAITLSRGRYSGAYVALGKYHFDKGELKEATVYFKKSLQIKPLAPNVWFRLGAIAMRLKDWNTALHAFTEVVQQEPEEGDAWANIAAVHMHNRDPIEAYPALVEASSVFCWTTCDVQFVNHLMCLK